MTETIENFYKETDKTIKGYAFDSLIFRYKLARLAQADVEAMDLFKSGKEDRESAKTIAKKRAERDVMRFIQILDKVIGEHY